MGDKYLTVIIRDPSPMIHFQESPTHRSVKIPLTVEQLKLIELKAMGTIRGSNYYEEIAMCFIEEQAKTKGHKS